MSMDGDEAEEALFSGEQELRLMAETIPALVWRAGPDGNNEYVNKRVLDYFGAPLGEIVGGGWAERVHPEDVAFKVSSWLDNLETENPHDVVCRFRGVDDRYRWFNVRGEPLRASDGTVLGWHGVLIDIDDRTKADAALRESEYRFRQIFETVPGQLWSADTAGELTQLNQRLLDYTGMRFEDFKNGGWEAFVHPDDYPETAKTFYHAIQTGTSFQAVNRLRRADGEFRWHHTRGEPLRDQQGRVVQWYGLSVDIDEAKKTEDRLRRSEAHLAEAQRLSRTGASAVTALMLAQEEHERLCQLESDLAHMNRLCVMGELTASLAHEITQPIATARNNARAAMHFLDRNPSDLGEIREALACIVGDADRAGDIIDRMRDHIKKAPPRKSRFDLNKAIDEVIGLARSTINTNGVSVRTHFTHALFPVEGDRVQLQQVVLNLILNAVEAMSTVEAGQRELLSSTERPPIDGVLVSVRDSGPGIDPDHLDRVFQAFYTTKSGGVGMGLSISRSIVDAHGGRLWADMNASGGAVLRFSLPGAGRELTNSRRSAHLTEEPHADTVSDAAHQTAYEGNK